MPAEGCPADARPPRPSPSGEPGHPIFALSTNESTLARSLAPPDSTPELTSTPAGDTLAIAVPTFSGVSPPDSMNGLRIPCARSQSNPFPDPFPASSMTMSAGERLASSMSSGRLAMNVLIIGAWVMARRPWMYIPSSDP